MPFEDYLQTLAVPESAGIGEPGWLFTADEIPDELITSYTTGSFAGYSIGAVQLGFTTANDVYWYTLLVDNGSNFYEVKGFVHDRPPWTVLEVQRQQLLMPGENWLLSVNRLKVGSCQITGIGYHDREDGPARTTTSATYVTMSGLQVITFIKEGTDTETDIEVVFHGTMFSTAISTGVYIGVQVDPATAAASDFDVTKFFFNEASTHRQVSGVRRIPGYSNDDVFTISMRWRRYSGTGTLTQDSNDHNSISVREVAKEV